MNQPYFVLAAGLERNFWERACLAAMAESGTWTQAAVIADMLLAEWRKRWTEAKV